MAVKDYEAIEYVKTHKPRPNLYERLADEQIHRMADHIDHYRFSGIPIFKGIGLAYYGGGQSRALRPPARHSGLVSWLVLIGHDDEEFRWAKVRSELPGMGMSCGSAAVTDVAIAAETAAIPVTIGASGALVAVSVAAATNFQCGLSIGRVINLMVDPKRNDLMDNEEWYQTATHVLDGVAVMGAVASLGVSAQAMFKIQKVSGKSFMEVLRGAKLNHQQRKELAKELGACVARKERVPWKKLVKSGKYSRLFAQIHIDECIGLQLAGLLSNSLTLGGSFLSSDVSSSSGVLRQLNGFIVHVVQE